MRSTTIVRFIQQSNRVSVWVAALILQEPKVRLRRKIVCNMIALMEVRSCARAPYRSYAHMPNSCVLGLA